MNELSIQLGTRIKQLRVLRNMTQEQLAQTSKVSISFLGNVERGSKNPTIQTVSKIADALDVTLSDLFAFDVPSQITPEPTTLELRRLLSEYSERIQKLYKK